MELAQMQEIATELGSELAALGKRVTNLELHSHDSFAPQNLFYVTDEGAKGVEAVNWRGPWNSVEAYEARDMVRFDKHLYVALTEVPAKEAGLVTLPSVQIPIGIGEGSLQAVGWGEPNGELAEFAGVLEDRTTPRNKPTFNTGIVYYTSGKGRVQMWQFTLERKALGEEIPVEVRLFDEEGNPLKPATKEAEEEWFNTPRNLRFKFVAVDGSNADGGEHSPTTGADTFNINTPALWPAGGAERREFLFLVIGGGAFEPKERFEYSTLPFGYGVTLKSTHFLPGGAGNLDPTHDPAHWEFVI